MRTDNNPLFLRVDMVETVCQNMEELVVKVVQFSSNQKTM